MMVGMEIVTNEDYLTPDQLAQRWGITLASLAMQRHRKQGPAYQKFGKAVRYRVEDIEEYETTTARHSTKEQE